MAKQVAKKIETEISNFIGIQKSNTKPPINACYELENMDMRLSLGDLHTRRGYSQKYAAPTTANYRNKLSAITFLSATNFYIPEVGGGREITVQVAKATVAGETPYNPLYGEMDPINALLVFIRPYWNGSSWVDAWRCLNEFYITKVDAATDYDLDLNFTDTTLKTNGLNNWTIIAGWLTDSPKIAQIIKTYDAGSDQVAVKVTNNSSFTSGDSVILMRNYIPYGYLTGMYNISASDVVFHKVLNDLRIGFGGEENRLGLSVGYRKKYWRFSSFDFGSGDTDLESDAAKESFSKIDEIILDPYTAINTDIVLDLSAVSSAGTMATGTYYFKLIGVLDGFNKVLVAIGEITIGVQANINVVPKILFGAHNKKFTSFEAYWSDDNELFWFLKKWDLSSATYENKDYIIDKAGYMALESGVDSNTPEMHTSNNAVSLTTDYDTTTDWEATGLFRDDVTSAIASVDSNPTPHGGSIPKCMKITPTTGNTAIAAKYSVPTEQNREYLIDFWVYSDAETIVYYGLRKGLGDIIIREYKSVLIPATTWTNISGIILARTTGDMDFYVGAQNIGSSSYIAIDDLSIKKRSLDSSLNETTDLKEREITDELNYIPTFDLAKSWDQAIVSGGRTLLINPYIDQRYENKIFFSNIVGANFMYDVITAENYYQLENFDGNDLIALEQLPNLDFGVFKSNSNHYLDSNSGRERLNEYGKGIVSRRGLVNFGRKIIYPGEYGVYLTDGFNDAVDIADGTIRIDYITNLLKSRIIATRDEWDNSYRMFSGNTATKKEYIFTKRGWLIWKQANYPQSFIIARDGSVWFMNNGVIYYTAGISGDAGTPIAYSWKSVPIDIALLANIKNNQKFYVHSVWVMYSMGTSIGNSSMNLKVYFDGSATAKASEAITWVDSTNREVATLDMPVPNNTCRYFQIGIDGNDDTGAQLQVHSIGVIWSTQGVGQYEH